MNKVADALSQAPVQALREDEEELSKETILTLGEEKQMPDISS